jgi:hypothetical protein
MTFSQTIKYSFIPSGVNISFFTGNKGLGDITVKEAQIEDEGFEDDDEDNDKCRSDGDDDDNNIDVAKTQVK